MSVYMYVINQSLISYIQHWLELVFENTTRVTKWKAFILSLTPLVVYINRVHFMKIFY